MKPLRRTGFATCGRFSSGLNTRTFRAGRVGLVLLFGLAATAAQAATKPAPAHGARPPNEQPPAWVVQRVAGNGGMESYEFGDSVALDGDTALVGAPGAGQTKGQRNRGAGAVYVFVRKNGAWIQTQKLTPGDDGTPYYSFGSSVALDNDDILIGAPGADVGKAFNSQGAVYVFTRSGGVWKQTTRLAAHDGRNDDGFGASLALSGNTLLIGAPGAGVDDNRAPGAVYVFAPSDGVWKQTAKLTAPENGKERSFGYSSFGTSVALSGTTALVAGSGWACRWSCPAQGQVYVFRKTGGSWKQTAMLTAGFGESKDGFGSALAVSVPAELAGDAVALVGAPAANVNGHADQGAVYVFTGTDDFWRQTAKLTAAHGTRGGEFGAAVALAGNVAFVGEPYADVKGKDSQGAAYVFTRSCRNIWNQAARLTASNGAAADEFGWTIAVSGTIRLIGTNSYQAYFLSRRNAGPAARASLTGEWTGTHGGHYYLHQDGDRLYGYGEELGGGVQPSADRRGQRELAVWTIVMSGRIVDGCVSGTWTNVSKGSDRPGHGAFTLAVPADGNVLTLDRQGGLGAEHLVASTQLNACALIPVDAIANIFHFVVTTKLGYPSPAAKSRISMCEYLSGENAGAFRLLVKLGAYTNAKQQVSKIKAELTSGGTEPTFEDVNGLGDAAFVSQSPDLFTLHVLDHGDYITISTSNPAISAEVAQVEELARVALAHLK